MSSAAQYDTSSIRPERGGREVIAEGLRRRQRSEWLFRACGIAAIGVAFAALAVLLIQIGATGWRAFLDPVVHLSIDFELEQINPDGLPLDQALRNANYATLLTKALQRELQVPETRAARRSLKQLLSPGATYELQRRLVEHPEWMGSRHSLRLPLADRAAQWMKAPGNGEQASGLSNQQKAWLSSLRERGLAKIQFSWRFLLSGDSRDPELAGLFGAFAGSILTLLVTLACCIPIGVGAAIYLEEFARKGWGSDLIEVNINNLAAVPSIVFGLLGLAVFLNFFELPRSSPMVGGLVLSLMTLPTIIIASRSALRAVPPSIREGALAIGASPAQAVFHHLLPMALPGIMTGTIVGMARALGETAPLLMIGMVAFVADIPEGVTSPATVLPVQIYIWSDSPERGFEEKTAGAIIVLLFLLILMNAVAISIRRRFEHKW